jgi:dihydroneopterin aldolase
VRAVIEGSRKHLIETLAEGIADGLLAKFAQVRAVTVEVTKPRPPVDFQFAGVAVRIRRERISAAPKS